MIDTATINYALNRVNEAWYDVLPHVDHVSEKYIEYVCMKAAIGFYSAWSVFFFGLFLVVVGLSFGYKEGEGDGLWVAPIVVGVVLIAVAAVGICCSSVDFFLSIQCPEMYAVHQLMGG